MAEQHVVTALIRKRAEIAGQLEATQNQARQLITDLDHVDATLRLYVPDIDLEEIKPKPLPPRHSAFRGELSRLILEALRRAPEGMTTQDLAQHFMAERGMNTADKATVKLIGKRVGSSLRTMRGKGLVQSEQGPGSFNLWRVVR